MFGLAKKLEKEIGGNDDVGREAGRMLAEDMTEMLARPPRTFQDVMRHNYYNLAEWERTGRNAIQAALAVSNKCEPK